MTTRILILAILAILPALACATGEGPTGLGPSPDYDGAFTSLWTDGNAELAGYRLTVPRYGVSGADVGPRCHGGDIGRNGDEKSR